jgi:glutathione S-transferase
MAQLELYELPCCPECKSVRTALAELDVEYDSTTVPRSHGKRGELAELTGQTCVPVLVDHQNGVTRTPQDGDVASYLDEAYRETPVASE